MITKNRVDEILLEDRSVLEWNRLLDSAKVADYESMELKDYFITEIQFKIDGTRHSKSEVLKSIEEGAADISDIGGY